MRRITSPTANTPKTIPITVSVVISHLGKIQLQRLPGSRTEREFLATSWWGGPNGTIIALLASNARNKSESSENRKSGEECDFRAAASSKRKYHYPAA